MDDRVQILIGRGADVIPTLPKALLTGGPGAAAEGAVLSADFVFLDHCKECYLKDLNSLESLGLLRKARCAMCLPWVAVGWQCLLVVSVTADSSVLPRGCGAGHCTGRR